MTYDDIRNKLSTLEKDFDENKFTISIDLRNYSDNKYQEYGITPDYIYSEIINAIVDEYVEHILNMHEKISEFPYKDNEFEVCLISKLNSELYNIKKELLSTFFKDDDELLKYFNKKINIKVYV